MELSEVIQKRVTVRRWKVQPVEKEKLLRVLERQAEGLPPGETPNRGGTSSSRIKRR